MYKIIAVSGVDAVDFLQGQLTQDIGKLAVGKCLPCAWCNASGRVVMTLKILAAGDEFLLVVPDTVAEAALARLSMYRLRARVEFAISDARWQLIALAGALRINRDTADGIWSTEINAPDPFVEIVATAESISQSGLDTSARLDDAAWQRARIAAGLVDIAAANSALYTPHMLNLDLIGAISFDKGCYTGQEIVARTEHLGRSKRRTFRYFCEADDLATGEVLRDGADEVGVIVNESGNDLLAVVAVAAAMRPLDIRGHAAMPKPLPYSLR